MSESRKLTRGILTMRYEHVQGTDHTQIGMSVETTHDGCDLCIIAAFARQYREDLDFRRFVNKAINFSRESLELPLEQFQRDT